MLKSRQTEIHQGAFLAAITAKGPVPEEIETMGCRPESEPWSRHGTD